MGKVAFLFSGQGAQYGGMGKELFSSSKAARTVFEMAEALRPGTIKQCFEGTKEELMMTRNTQPCLFAADLACAAALTEAGVRADGAAGFSLGELAAASFCGVMSCKDGFSLACDRARLMDACAEKQKGAMAAVLKLETALAEELCREAGVYPANYNCPSQLVASGGEDGIDALIKSVAEHGGRAVKLSVGGAFHSPFMEEASEGLYGILAGRRLNTPKIPLYSNVTAGLYGADAAVLMAKQVSSPVLWQKTIENMIYEGFDVFIEAGAGKTLSALVKKIAGDDVLILNAEDNKSFGATVCALGGGKLC